MMDSQPAPAPAELSRRARRRLIQRATVLAGRKRRVRQHIREARLTMLWILEDLDFEWSVVLDRGKMDFDRRPVKKPDLIVKWAEGEKLFETASRGSNARDACEIEAAPELNRLADLIVAALVNTLGEVLKFPFDDDGVRLA